MANSYDKGRVFIDTASDQAVATDKRIKVLYILFIPDAASDQCVIREDSTGEIVFKLSGATAKQQEPLDFSRSPIVMDGVFVDTLSSNAIVILYTTTRGGR